MDNGDIKDTDQFQSTHSLRSATYGVTFTPEEAQFQSTHSLRSATKRFFSLAISKKVSIHALLAECDIF